LQVFVLQFLVKIDGTGGTYFFTGPAFALLDVDAAVAVDTIFQWNGLGVFDKGGFALDQPAVVWINDLFGTFFSTGAAGDAQRLVDVSRVVV